MEIQILTAEQYSVVEPIMKREMPQYPTIPYQSVFPALFDGEKLAGFVWIEHLYHFNSLYVVPEYRGRRNVAPALIQAAVAAIPRGHAAICLPDPRQEHLQALARRMGARQLLSRVVLRKDVF